MLVFNATLLVQMFHFAIAYGIVRFFIFKPLLKALSKEETVGAHTKAIVQERRLLIEEKRKALVTSWNRYKVDFALHSPLAQRITMRLPVPTHSGGEPSIPVTSEQIEKIAQQIITQVDHVR